MGTLGPSSSDASDKYPVVHNDSTSYPEVVMQKTQSPLNTYEPANAAAYSQYPYQHQNGYAPPEAGLVPPPSPSKRNPWGLSPLAFGALIATITAIVVGAAVGGGVGAALSGVPVTTVTVTAGGSLATTTSSASSSPSGTASVLPQPSSLKDYVAAEPYYVDTLAVPDCLTNTLTVKTASYTSKFNLYCGTDFGNSHPDDTKPSLNVADFVGIFAYSITDCLYACSSAIHFTQAWGQDHDGGNMQSCKGVTWRSGLASSNATFGANCWLKNGTTTKDGATQCNTCVSAALVQ